MSGLCKVKGPRRNRRGPFFSEGSPDSTATGSTSGAFLIVRLWRPSNDIGRSPAQHAALAPEVGDCAMLRGAIVPDGDVANRPAPTQRIFWLGHTILQDRVEPPPIRTLEADKLLTKWPASRLRSSVWNWRGLPDARVHRRSRGASCDIPHRVRHPPATGTAPGVWQELLALGWRHTAIMTTSFSCGKTCTDFDFKPGSRDNAQLLKT